MFTLGPLETLLIVLASLVLFALNRRGKLDPKTLLAIVGSLSVASFFTPPDPASTILLCGVLMGVFFMTRSRFEASDVDVPELAAVGNAEGLDLDVTEKSDVKAHR